MRMFLTTVVVLAATVMLSPIAKGQSFNCHNAKTPDEVLICQNRALSTMDEKLADLYSGLRNHAKPWKQRVLEADQANWLRFRRNCGRDVKCIAHAYQDRVNQLYYAVHDTCSGPIMKQPTWCDAGGANGISDEDVTDAIQPRVDVTPPAAPQPVEEKESVFDQSKIAALLDKRDPTRQAITGTTRGTAATLSQSELDAMRARLASLWNVQPGVEHPEELFVTVRIQLNPDRRLAKPPVVVSTGSSPRYQEAADAAVRAVLLGQPYTMLREETYEQWKYMDIDFDPKSMFREQHDHATVPPPASQDQKYLRKGTCVTLDGKEFEWPFPNVPWNTLSCS
jgi:uncharacterized protein